MPVTVTPQAYNAVVNAFEWLHVYKPEWLDRKNQIGIAMSTWEHACKHGYPRESDEICMFESMCTSFLLMWLENHFAMSRYHMNVCDDGWCFRCYSGDKELVIRSAPTRDLAVLVGVVYFLEKRHEAKVDK